MSNNEAVIAELDKLSSRLSAIEQENSLLRGILSSYSTEVTSNGHELVSAAATSISTIDSGDTAWMLSSCALVLFMCVPGGYVSLQNCYNLDKYKCRTSIRRCTTTLPHRYWLTIYAIAVYCYCRSHPVLCGCGAYEECTHHCDAGESTSSRQSLSATTSLHIDITLHQIFSICCLISFLWLCFGYSLAFGPISNENGN